MGLWNQTACTLGTACLRQSGGTLLGLPDLVKPLTLWAGGRSSATNHDRLPRAQKKASPFHPKFFLSH